MMPNDTKILLDGLLFPEGPRWHGGKLWFQIRTKFERNPEEKSKSLK